jgi:peptidoglycan hydrolase-like protein with peptidoglycan-binding domain
MKYFFRRFPSRNKFYSGRRKKISRRRVSASLAVRNYHNRKKRRLVIAVTVAAAAVIVPVFAATAAYGDEIWQAPFSSQTEASVSDLQEETEWALDEDNRLVEEASVQEDTAAQEQPQEDTAAQEQPQEDTAAQEQPQQDTAAQEQPQQDTAAQEQPQEDTAAQEQPQEDTAAQEQPQEDTAAQEQPQQDTATQAAPILNEQQKLFTEDIQPGEESPLVKTIQSRLMELHYMEEDDPTELFGPITQQAIGYFQRKHGLEVTQVATVETLQALFADDAKEYTVTIGASGTDVEEIQKRLDSLGYSVSATGYFGTDTDAAVKEFQKNNELGVDGSVGYYTKEALYSEDAITKSGEEAGNESSGETSGESSVLEAFIDEAYAQLGKPYVLGAKGPNAFDCSGLIYYCLNQAGYDIGYMTSGGWRSSGFETITSIDDLQRGDIICMDGHVAIYLGDGTVIDASSSQNAMVHRDFGSWFRNGFLCAKRVF